MGVFEQFPYTNFHDLNLDWIVSKIKEFESTMDAIVAEKAEEYFNNIFIDAVYDADTQTIRLAIEEVNNG